MTVSAWCFQVGCDGKHEYECGVDFCENCGCCYVCYSNCCESRDDGVCWVSDETYHAVRRSSTAS